MDVSKENASQSRVELPAKMLPGLRLLLEAYNYGRQLHRGAWDFAVEMSLLQNLGFVRNDFRWLVYKGYLEHAVEVTDSDDDCRKFSHDGTLVFSEGSCFVLTESGARVAESLPSDEHSVQPNTHIQPSADTASESTSATNGLVPVWDPHKRQLSVGEFLVKEFKLRAPTQEAILTVFAEEGWPPRVDDPLPPLPDADPKERLRNTVKNLNRRQSHHLIRFMADGTGTAVRWELIPQDQRKGPVKRPK